MGTVTPLSQNWELEVAGSLRDEGMEGVLMVSDDLMGAHFEDCR